MAQNKSEEKQSNEEAKNKRFKGFYMKYRQKIYWYVYRKISNAELSEDLTADVFMKLYERWDDVSNRDEKGMCAWVYTVARNASIDHLRKSKNRKKRPIEDEEVDSATRVFEDFVGEAMKEEKMEYVSKALESIGEEEQEILTLRFEEGMRFREIAKIVDKEEGACKMTMYRSIKKIKDKLNELYS
ncbi:sigma-70 family RNA polymerase sigma factor [Candidatus Dojkabacteria bacterium]|nr:sigma-70 family RNA polymerase sigma factor [Candidatus Dojkabacteria bacterium]